MVVAICKNAKAVRTMERKIEKVFSLDARRKILVLQADEFFNWMSKKIAKESIIEKGLKGIA